MNPDPSGWVKLCQLCDLPDSSVVICEMGNDHVSLMSCYETVHVGRLEPGGTWETLHMDSCCNYDCYW